MKLAITLLSLACVFGLSQAQSVKSCGKDGDILQNAVFSVSPDPISKSAPLTITATGTLGAAVTGGSLNVDLNVKALGIINEPIKLQSPFSLSPGAVAGPQNMVIGPFTLPKVPGSTTVSGTVTGADASGKEIFCVALNLDVATPPEDIVTPEAKPVVSNCGSDTDHLKNISTSSAGGVSTLTGTLDEPITSGSVAVDMSVKVSFFKIPIQMNIPFKYTPGLVAGPIKLSVGPSSSSMNSGINVDVEGTVKFNDASSAEIACLSVSTPSTITTTLIPEFLAARAANTSHYEDPKPNGCQSDEQAIQIQGISGDFCTPKCTGILKTKCPTDVPDGVTATPQCALKDTSGNKYCALICQPGSNDSCGKATCKSIQGTGICTYDD